jgi:AraC family transcriptional regulator
VLKSATTLAPWQMLRVKAYIEAHIGQSLRVTELARLARLSARYFSAAFKGSIGEPPHKYVVHCRVRHACHLMVMTQESLSEIALFCGFSD